MSSEVRSNAILRTNSITRNIALVIGASLVIAICARLSVPLPFTPVPFTLANFGVLAVGILLGSRRGAAASILYLAYGAAVGILLGSRRGAAASILYLAYGAAGMPVFSPAGPGGLIQLFGATAGYLWAYPLVAFIAGWISERGDRSFTRNLAAATVAELVLFLSGISWLFAFTHSWQKALMFGGYWFVFGEVIKIMASAGLGSRLRRIV